MESKLPAHGNKLKTQPNEHLCRSMRESHILAIPPCCPYSGNPLDGSTIKITYSPLDHVLEVAALRAFVDSYKGGKGKIRSMEGMIQSITQECANAVKVCVEVVAILKIAPSQEMILECTTTPKEIRK